MNFSIIRYILSSVLCFEGVFFLLPTVTGLIYKEQQAFVYLILSLSCIFLGILGRMKKPKNKTFYSKEGFATVALSWILLSMIGALPFYITKEIPSYVDALFETISGFTTTGSTILVDIEVISRCSLFWRSFTHWVGGMGVLVFIMAVIPLSGGSNIHLMRAESPGPTVGKLVPKIKSTAMILYGIYVLITITEIVALLLAGLDLFTSTTLTFGTVGTGGFALLNSSIASYSTTVQIIITIFMIISSINFMVYYLILIGKAQDAIVHEEMRWFLGIIIVSTIAIVINIRDQFDSLFECIQTTLFQVASIISTTGYVTVDFDLWPMFSKTILLILMMVGACAGSTGGGIKVSRVIIIAKAIKNEIISIAHPRSIQRVKIENRKVSDETLKKVFCYLSIYVLIIIFSVLIVSIDGKDFGTNISAVLATFNNIGPGFNQVGAVYNFNHFSVLSKLVLMFDMLVGRLEIFPLLVLFTPGIWKKSKKQKL